MVYSFFAPDSDGIARRGLGTFIILDHITRAGRAGMPYIYLGYWIAGANGWTTRPTSPRSNGSDRRAGSAAEIGCGEPARGAIAFGHRRDATI